MNSKFAQIIAIVALLMAPLVAHARHPVAIVDFPDNTVFTSSGSALTVNQVRDAITAAAQSRSWQTSRSSKGDALQAMLHVRGKHTVVVEISYSDKSYSITYANSTNMKFSNDPETNVRLIHPFYNRWVSDLREAIRAELLKL
jgi:hypothetical protein